MSNLVSFAERELDLIGMTADGDEYNKAMREHLLHMVSEFSKEGHSGFSASYAINCLKKLMNYEALSPLTGEDHEWSQVDAGPHMKWQNNRCYHVFKREDGTAYDGDGKIFWEWYIDPKTGEKHKSYYTNSHSRVDITFPYVPVKEYVFRESEAEKT